MQAEEVRQLVDLELGFAPSAVSFADLEGDGNTKRASGAAKPAAADMKVLFLRAPKAGLWLIQVCKRAQYEVTLTRYPSLPSPPGPPSCDLQLFVFISVPRNKVIGAALVERITTAYPTVTRRTPSSPVTPALPPLRGGATEAAPSAAHAAIARALSTGVVSLTASSAGTEQPESGVAAPAAASSAKLVPDERASPSTVASTVPDAMSSAALPPVEQVMPVVTGASTSVSPGSSHTPAGGMLMRRSPRSDTSPVVLTPLFRSRALSSSPAAFSHTPVSDTTAPASGGVPPAPPTSSVPPPSTPTTPAAARLLKSPDRTTVLCCTDRPHPSVCGISRIWVHAEHRRSGVATRLMEAVRSEINLRTFFF